MVVLMPAAVAFVVVVVAAVVTVVGLHFLASTCWLVCRAAVRRRIFLFPKNDDE